MLEDIPEEEQDGVDPSEDDYLDGDYVADADEADSDIDDPKVILSFSRTEQLKLVLMLLILHPIIIFHSLQNNGE